MSAFILQYLEGIISVVLVVLLLLIIVVGARPGKRDPSSRDAAEDKDKSLQK